MGDLYEVYVHSPDGTVRGLLRRPQGILGLLRRVRETTNICFVHFTGKRATRTFRVQRDSQPVMR